MAQTFVFLLANLLLVSSTLATLHVPGKDARARECVRDVDVYLNTLGIKMGKENTSERIRSALDSAIERLELVDYPMESNIFGPKKKEALKRLVASKCPAEQLQSLVKGLREAAFDDECGQVSLDFLMTISNSKLAPQGKDKPLLKKFACRRVESCWLRFVATVIRGIDRAMGKMTMPVFGLIERLAKKVADIRSQGAANKPPRNSAKLVKIDESKVSEAAEDVKMIWADGSSGQPDTLHTGNSSAIEEIIAMFKQVKFETEENRMYFAQALSSLFNSYRQHRDYADQEEGTYKTKNKTQLIRQAQEFHVHYLVNPCNELVDRLKSLMTPAAFYRRINHKIGEVLAKEKLTNLRLSYELQVYRICKLANGHRRELDRLLVSLH